MSRRIALSIAFIGFNLMACCCGGGPAVIDQTKRLPGAPILFTDRFGAADVEDSTERDKPRPLVLTHWLIYNKEKVKVISIPADDHKGNRVPVLDWKIKQYQDPTTNTVLSDTEVLSRMAARDRENKQTTKAEPPKTTTPKENEPTTKEPEKKPDVEKKPEPEKPKEVVTRDPTNKRVTQANFAKIQKGWTAADVAELLGTADKRTPLAGSVVMVWSNGALPEPTVITITLKNNRVDSKTIIGE